MKRFEEQIKAKLGGRSLEEFIEKLRAEKDLQDEEKGRAVSAGIDTRKGRKKLGKDLQLGNEQPNQNPDKLRRW